MPSFAILRFKKHRATPSIGAASSHMTRDRETPNADPDRLGANRVLIGGDASPADLAEARHDDALTRIGKPPRANGVRAIEVFVGTSPEWHANASPADRAAWERQSQDWLVRTFGKDNVVSLIAHHDERTPHLTGFVVPVDPATGRLNASRWLGGAQKLAALQTGYADSVAGLGLERGREGSTAKHQTVKQFYAALASDVGTVTVPPVATPPIAVTGREDWAKAETQRIAKAIRPQVEALQLQARAGLATARRVDTLQADATDARKLASSVRELPMTDVLTHLALKPDPDNPKQWVDDERRFRITIDGRRFYDHNGMTGGGGAIDLAKHVMEVDYGGAVAWLGATVGVPGAARSVAAHAVEASRAVVAEAQAERAPFTLPSVPTDRAVAHGYLVGQRGLDADQVDQLIDAGAVVTDARKNTGFVLVDEEGTPRGIELYGSDPARPFAGFAPGSSRDATFRVAHDRGRTGRPPPRVVLTRSAVDALAYMRLHAGPEPVLVASMSGSRTTLPASLKKAVQRAAEVVVAYANDAQGDRAATALLSSLKAWYKGVRKRLRPLARTWADDLLRRPAAVRPPPTRGRGIE